MMVMFSSKLFSFRIISLHFRLYKIVAHTDNDSIKTVHIYKSEMNLSKTYLSISNVYILIIVLFYDIINLCTSK